MSRSGFHRLLGPENFLANIDVALERARALLAQGQPGATVTTAAK